MANVHTNQWAKGKVHYVGNLVMFAEDGIVHVMNRNPKTVLKYSVDRGGYEEVPEDLVRQYTVKEFVRNLNGVHSFASLEDGRLEDDNSVAMREEHKKCTLLYNAGMEVVKEALAQGDPMNPKVMDEMIRDCRLQTKYYKTASIYNTKKKKKLV